MVSIVFFQQGSVCELYILVLSLYERLKTV